MAIDDSGTRAPLSRAELQQWQCRPLGPSAAIDAAAARAQLGQLPGWQVQGALLEREYRFGGYEATLAFVNAVAALAAAQDHHPEIVFGYDRCTVRWNTHSAGGLTLNDFGCAVRTDEAAARVAG